MKLPTTDQIAGWLALGISMLGVWKGYVVWVKEHSFGKTLSKQLKANIAAMTVEIEALKEAKSFATKEREEIKEDLDYLEERLEKIKDKIIDKISL